MKNEEEERIENESIILANSFMAFVQNPPGIKYHDEVRDGIAKTILEQLKQERNKAIDDCIEIARKTGSNGMTYKQYLQKQFESLKQ